MCNYLSFKYLSKHTQLIQYPHTPIHISRGVDGEYYLISFEKE